MYISSPVALLAPEFMNILASEFGIYLASEEPSHAVVRRSGSLPVCNVHTCVLCSVYCERIVLLCMCEWL